MKGKGGVILENFYLTQTSIKRCQITLSNPPEEKMLSVVIWHLFWRFEPKWKKKSEIKPPLTYSSYQIPNPESTKLFTEFTACFDLIRTCFRLRIWKKILIHFIKKVTSMLFENKQTHFRVFEKKIRIRSFRILCRIWWTSYITQSGIFH